MRFDGRFIGFGVFLIVAGAVLLGVRQGWIPTATAERAWTLWPLLLVGGGLSIVLEKRPGAAIGGLIVAGTFGVVLGGLAATGAGFPFGVCSSDGDGAGVAFPAAGGELTGPSQVALDADCGDLTISTIDGSSWRLEGSSEDGVAPSVEESGDGLRIESGRDGPFGFSDAPDTWRFSLPADVKVGLDVSTNAGEADLDLATADLDTLAVSMNAGSIGIDLRDAAAIGRLDVGINAGSATIWLPSLAFSGDLNVNAGSIALCAPDDVALRIVVNDNITASFDFASAGLVQRGNAWESEDYGTSEVRIVLDAEANAASVSLDSDRSCNG